MSKIDLTNLNKVDTELVLPSTSENTSLQKLQENKWGSILNNQTFNTLNNNIKLLKNSLVETINILNNENIFAKNKYINEENNIISLGDNTKKLNFLTTQIQVNGVDTEFLTSQNLSNISNIAYKDKENTFIYPLNTNQYNINSNQVISDDNENINIGNNQRKLNLQSSDGKLYLNGQEFKGGNNSNEIKSNSIETNSLKVGGENVITDTSNFAKLNSINTFTQKIKGTDIESNKSITQELILNGINVNLKDYATSNNLISQLEKIIGLTYGGVIQDNINKITGKFYYDSVTKFYYECIADTNLTYNESSKFRAISNKPLSDKVENLFKIEVLPMTNLLGYTASINITEWYVPLPNHIDVNKIISVTNVNLGAWMEYSNIDFASKCIRAGCMGDLSTITANSVKVLVAYFT